MGSISQPLDLTNIPLRFTINELKNAIPSKTDVLENPTVVRSRKHGTSSVLVSGLYGSGRLVSMGIMKGVSSSDILEGGQIAPTPGLVYEIVPGHAEGWERVTLERRTQGVKVVVCQGHAEYALEPTPFVLEGLLTTIRRISRGELPKATLGCVGLKALERTSRRILA
jgi:hypothetical protein